MAQPRVFQGCPVLSRKNVAVVPHPYAVREQTQGTLILQLDAFALAEEQRKI